MLKYVISKQIVQALHYAIIVIIKKQTSMMKIVELWPMHCMIVPPVLIGSGNVQLNNILAYTYEMDTLGTPY